MKPEIVERPSVLLAGVINCGKGVTDIDIHGLWNVYAKSESAIQNRVEGMWYELHVGTKLGNGIYSVIVGVEVMELVELPIEISLRVVPAGEYAYFSHCMKDGGFSEAFDKVEAWVNESGTKVKDFGLQLYDKDYDPKNDNSILHICIPLV